MIRIAIVEDELSEAETLKAYIARFSEETGETCSVDVYGDGLSFLDGYQHNHDVIFMDIEMPHLNGMDTAHRLRAINEELPLVFVTNMKQFAIEGYAVSALDFILKPVSYSRLSAVLKKISRTLQHSAADEFIRTENGVIRVRMDEVSRIEVQGRDIIYHTQNQDIHARGRLKELEEKLAPSGFVRCSNYCLVNLRHVTALEKEMVSVGGAKVEVSQRRRKDLLRAMGLYMGEK